MFEIGQLVIQQSGECLYGIQKGELLCIVTEVCPLKVQMVATTQVYMTTDNHFTVEENEWCLCTYDEFLQKNGNSSHGYVKTVNGYTEKKLKQIKNDAEEKKMELRMNKEIIGQYILSAEERNELRDEIVNLLEEYDYHPTDSGVDKIIDEWIKNKGWMINLFKKHPNYNGKFQITFDSDYSRCCNKEALWVFGEFLRVKATKLKVKKQIGAFSCQEIEAIIDRLEAVCDYMRKIDREGQRADKTYHVTVNGKTSAEMRKEYREWIDRREKYLEAERRGEIYNDGYITYDKESWVMFTNMRRFGDLIKNETESIATEEFAQEVNQLFPKVKAVAGQKVSRIVNKVYTMSGLEVDREYNQEFAKYSDAINPLSIKRHTILSCHPIDYLTMSFGNSWASCHTIDKQNKRGLPDNYSGCYSSGTLSYMLDESSFVFYTVDKDYNGNQYELQDKINRNMFHMGEDKLIQARVYPQTTDGETGIYRQIRVIAQKVIADCLEVPNLWKNIKGRSECEYVITSKGTHYRDYANFEDCNVSYLKDETDMINKKDITVGHNPICPSCGESHCHQEAIECESCFDEEVRCYTCGERHSRENMHEIDGDWYCEDCCFYCEFHDEWEVGSEDDSFYVQDYGRICEDALNYSDEFITCERCGEIYRIRDLDELVVTEDGNTYCCYRCAEKDDYMCVDSGEWYPSEEVYYCEHCETYVHADDWNAELECCTECEEEVKAEKETEREAV